MPDHLRRPDRSDRTKLFSDLRAGEAYGTGFIFCDFSLAEWMWPVLAASRIGAPGIVSLLSETGVTRRHIEVQRVNRSRPVYSGLKPDPFARSHLILAEGQGAGAVIDVFADADPAFAKCATLLYVAAPGTDPELLHRLGRLNAETLRVFADVVSLLQDCAHRMEEATMGTTVYVCGPADFIARVAGVAARYGVDFDSMRTEHRGSPAKRVLCVHCKAIEEQVLDETVCCSQCKLRLFVRDHYSHRLNAFMGVSLDAEGPVARLPVSDPAS